MTNNGAISPCKALSTVDINLGMNRGDGYEWQYGRIAIQGVRIFDPTSSQWLTPDADAGNVHDPMSQKPFMWNDNNPVEYSDPSGYEDAFAGDAAHQKKEKEHFDAVKKAAQKDPAAKKLLIIQNCRGLPLQSVLQRSRPHRL